jgi:hypothetical protein
MQLPIVVQKELHVMIDSYMYRCREPVVPAATPTLYTLTSLLQLIFCRSQLKARK